MWKLLERVRERYDHLNRQLTEPSVLGDIALYTRLSKEAAELREVISYIDRYERLQRDLQEAAKISPNAQGVVERLFRHALKKENWKLAADCVARARKANLDGSGGRIYEMQLAGQEPDLLSLA